MGQIDGKRVCKYEGCSQSALNDGTKGIPLCQQHSDEFAEIVQNWEANGPARAIKFWMKTGPFSELSWVTDRC